MKILFSPSKEMDSTDLISIENDIQIKHVESKIEYIKNIEKTNYELELKAKAQMYDIHQQINTHSKKAIQLYNGLAFRQLENKSDEFYDNLIILSSLYGFSKGTDFISPHRLDYTTVHGRKFKKEFYEEINKKLACEETIYNLASNEFVKDINHANMIDFEFFICRQGQCKQISAISKKMRGKMVNYIRLNGINKFNQFEEEQFKLDIQKTTNNKYVYVKYEN